MGLTLFDLPQKGVDVPLTMSHVAARQEIRELLNTLQLPGLERATAKL
jgi:chromosome partitioning protein